MATLLQNIASVLGIGNSEAQASSASVPTGTTNAAFHLDLSQTLTGEQLLVAGPNDATLTATTDQRAILMGAAGNDHLVGGDHPDVLIGGGGTNVMTGGGGVDVFGHSSGAVDVITDFSPAAGEKIALATGLTFTGSTSVQVNPATFGLSGTSQASTQLNFSDGSHVILLGSHETPTSDWFI
ncbi:MAG TPA: hypothetical protein VL974_08475 [Magnetospirillum sp.]|jgi:Ca2+-binding RTX toxin-like protein|nr:hypothetical protein [Magnetospirillum sp.]